MTSVEDSAHYGTIANVAWAVALTILYYDHTITFGDEIKYFWRWPISRGSLLFLLNRYFSYFSHIALLFIRYARPSKPSCEQWQLFNQLTIVITQILVLIILMLRTYALYNCDKRILVLFIVVAVVGSGVGCSEFIKGRRDPSPTLNSSGSACLVSISDQNVTHIAVAWIVQFGIDLLIFLLTLFRTWNFPRRGDTLPHIIRRDGLIYFGVIAFVNLANILTFYLLPPPIRGCLATFASCVSVTLVSRLNINLQQPAQTTYLTSGPVDIVEDRSMFRRDHTTFADTLVLQSMKTLAYGDDDDHDTERNSTFTHQTEDGLLSYKQYWQSFPVDKRS